MLLSLTSVQSEVGTIADLSSRLEVLSEKITGISQQLTERHLYLDEQTRADGNSGLKQVSWTESTLMRNRFNRNNHTEKHSMHNPLVISEIIYTDHTFKLHILT